MTHLCVYFAKDLRRYAYGNGKSDNSQFLASEYLYQRGIDFAATFKINNTEISWMAA